MFDIKTKREDDGLTVIREQPGRVGILESVKQLRHEGGAKDADGLGRWALSIPFEDWVRLRAKYPALASNDPKVKSRAYFRFMATPEAEPFKVREKI